MSKKRTQVRRQVRQVKPKVAAPPASPASQKKQKERYFLSGGMLQGYDPEFVLKLGYGAAAGVVLSLLIMVELIVGPLAPHGLGLRIIAALAWLIPIFFLLSTLAPGVRLAWQDRKQEAKVVQGQLLGASDVSQSLGLGMIMVKTRGGNENYLCPPDRLAKVPGNQVNVVMSVTPLLRHVRSVAIMGQRLMPRPQPPAPSILRRMQLMPLVTPVALALAVILGDDLTAFLPIPNDLVHITVAVLVAAVLGGIVYGASFLLQRRLAAQIQTMVPS